MQHVGHKAVIKIQTLQGRTQHATLAVDSNHSSHRDDVFILFQLSDSLVQNCDNFTRDIDQRLHRIRINSTNKFE